MWKARQQIFEDRPRWILKLGKIKTRRRRFHQQTIQTTHFMANLPRRFAVGNPSATQQEQCRGIIIIPRITNLFPGHNSNRLDYEGSGRSTASMTLTKAERDFINAQGVARLATI